jgi:hypothetical protein
VTAARSFALIVRVSLGSIWATSLVVLGLWAILDAPTKMSIACAGIASIAMGLFLFMTFVADRLFPAAGGRLSIWIAEMATFLVFLGGCVAAFVSYGGGLA